MSHTKKQFIGLISIATLFSAEAIIFSVGAFTITSAKIPVHISQAPPWRQTYLCGDFTITLSQQGTDRYTYQAINAKGQTLILKNGSHHGGRNYSSIYTFNRDDGSQFVLEDFGGGKAALSIGNYPNQGMTYDCTTDGNP